MRLHGISERFQAADVSRPKLISEEYDPAKYLRGQKLILSKSVVSEQILPSEDNMIRIVEDVPLQNVQEVVVSNISNIVYNPTIEEKIVAEEEVKDINHIHNGVHIDVRDVKENIIPIDSDNSGVLNVKNLYVPENKEVNLLLDRGSIDHHHTNEIIKERSYSEEKESELSEIKNYNNLLDQHLKDQYVYQPEMGYDYVNSNDLPKLKEPVYTYNTIDHESEAIPESQKVDLVKSELIPTTIDYVHPNDVDSPFVRNGDYYKKEFHPCSSIYEDPIKVKATESDNKIKLVYNVAPLIKTYIKENSAQQILESQLDLNGNEFHRQNPSKKVTGVSEEFVYNDPNSNEILKVRVSLKNKNTSD